MDARTPPPHAPNCYATLASPDTQYPTHCPLAPRPRNFSSSRSPPASGAIYRTTTHPHGQATPTAPPPAPARATPPHAFLGPLLLSCSCSCRAVSEIASQPAMAAGAGKSSKEADPARCRRHPKHRHAAGVCPFCLRDRLSRLSAAASGSGRSVRADAAYASASSSSSTFSPPCSSWEETVAQSSSGQAPRQAHRGSLALLLRQEGREAAALASGRRAEQEQEQEEERKAKRGNFWARLQHQLHHGGWHKKDGCSVAA